MALRPNVVIIDGDSDFAQKLQDCLETSDIEAAFTENGRTGLDLARQNGAHAIVLCVELPKMSGYKICSSLKKDPDLKDIPVVITSSGATPAAFDQHRRLKKVHAQAYMHKPIEPAALADVLCTLMGLDSVDENDAVDDDDDNVVETGAIIRIEAEPVDDLMTEQKEEAASPVVAQAPTPPSADDESSEDSDDSAIGQDVEVPRSTRGTGAAELEDVQDKAEQAVEESDEDDALDGALDGALDEVLDEVLDDALEPSSGDEPANDSSEPTDDSEASPDSEPEQPDSKTEDAENESSADIDDVPADDDGQSPKVETAEVSEDDAAEPSVLHAEDVVFTDIPQDKGEATEKSEEAQESESHFGDLDSTHAVPSEADDNLPSLRAQNLYLKSCIEKLEIENSDLQIEHGRAESARSSRISVSTRETLALKKERNAIQKELIQLKSTIAQRDSELLTWNDREMELESKIVDLQDENDELLTQKADLEDDLVGKKSKVSKTESRLSKLTEEHDALVNSHTQTKSMLSTLELEAEELRSQMPDDSDEQKIQEIEAELIIAHTDIKSLQDAVQAKEAELSAQAETHDKDVADKGELIGQLESTKSSLENAHAEQAELRIALDEAELNKEVVVNRLDEVSASLTAVAEMRSKALKALQVAQNLLYESAQLSGDEEFSYEYTGDLDSQDLSDDVLRDLSSGEKPE
jgi:CheY-like chemotaxis protein